MIRRALRKLSHGFHELRFNIAYELAAPGASRRRVERQALSAAAKRGWKTRRAKH